MKNDYAIGKLDLKIIKEFIEFKDGDKLTTWKIMKKICPDGHDTEHMSVVTRLQKLAEYNLFSIQKNGNLNDYSKIPENFKIGFFNFPKNNLNDKKRKKSKGIMMNLDGKYAIFEI